LYSERERDVISRRLAAEDSSLALAETTSITPTQVAGLLAAAGSPPLSHSQKIADVAKRQSVSLAGLFAAVGVGAGLEREAVVTAELELKYAGYFTRERDQAAKMRRMGQFSLGGDIPYHELRSLSFEARQKLSAVRPSTLAQAARIPGVSPTDLQNLVLEIEKRRRQATAKG
jgi:tRNA uridine 5-carboxymethylaminomethyl modification enzyme